MSDLWQEYIDKNWEAYQALLRARGHKPKPIPEHLAKKIREMPNLFLDSIYQKLNFGKLD